MTKLIKVIKQFIEQRDLVIYVKKLLLMATKMTTKN